MYETYYGFAEKPFSLTPDPKYLYRSQSHANAFELLQYAIRRREGFVVVTGDIGTGKTTLCRALLEEIDRTTFTALVLNPFLSEEDLLKRILQDFGVVSRENIKAGQLAGVTKQDLIETLYDFLLGLIPLKANAVLIIDEAQNLPLPVLEQIRILSNLETDKEKLLQIILVGQLNLGTLLRSPELRQLDQRVSIRYQLEPLDRETVGGVRRASPHDRRRIGGGHVRAQGAGSAAPAVGRHPAPHQSDLRPRAAGGLFGPRESRHARHGGPCGREPRRAADRRRCRTCAAGARRSPGRRPSRSPRRRSRSGRPRISISDLRIDRFMPRAAPVARRPPTPDAVTRVLPADAPLTILVGVVSGIERAATIATSALTERLETSGYDVYYADVDLGPNGRWQRVLAGAYTDPQVAQREADRVERSSCPARARS